MGIANFFEWGILCDELGMDGSTKVQPIYSFSFQWQTKPPETFTFANFDYAGIIYGIGEYKFEMRSSVGQAKLQELFKRQKRIKMAIVRFANQDGNIVEIERYTIMGAVVGSYEFISRSNEISQRFLISIYGTSNDEFMQTVWNEDGSIKGKVVTAVNTKFILST